MLLVQRLLMELKYINKRRIPSQFGKKMRSLFGSLAGSTPAEGVGCIVSFYCTWRHRILKIIAINIGIGEDL